MRRFVDPKTTILLVALVFPTLLLFACGGDRSESEEATDEGTSSSAMPAAGACLQLLVTVEDGFEVDGRSTTEDQIGPSLVRALEAGDRSAVVDLKCGDEVTMASVFVLHEAMREHKIHRIQYFRDPESAIPHVILSAGMQAQLDRMPDESTRKVSIDASNALSLDGTVVGMDALRSQTAAVLEENPDLILVVQTADEVRYSAFVELMGALTDAGAQRIVVQPLPG